MPAARCRWGRGGGGGRFISLLSCQCFQHHAPPPLLFKMHHVQVYFSALAQKNLIENAMGKVWGAGWLEHALCSPAAGRRACLSARLLTHLPHLFPPPPLPAAVRAHGGQRRRRAEQPRRHNVQASGENTTAASCGAAAGCRLLPQRRARHGAAAGRGGSNHPRPPVPLLPPLAAGSGCARSWSATACCWTARRP